jgi:exodeoxyribonuclease VII large subunit
VIEQMQLAGLGALMKLFEERKKKLEAEGLFAAERKRPIPYLPEVIAVVTSPTGAVIRDILHRLQERFPRHVLIRPVLVQGEGAAEQIAQAIGELNALKPGGAVPRPDLLIVARGGGSIEDLWAFNEEIVVRAAAASEIPLISAVGHETDTTLIDYAADLRAPTPTAAAELAVPVRRELIATVEQLQGRLTGAADRLLKSHRRHLEGLARGLPEPRMSLGYAVQRLDDQSERLRLALATLVRDRRSRLVEHGSRLHSPAQRLDFETQKLTSLMGRLEDRSRLAISRAAERLDNLKDRPRPLIERHLVQIRRELAHRASMLGGLSHHAVLKRGYAIVRSLEDGHLIPRRREAERESALEIGFVDGEITVLPQKSGKTASRSGGGKSTVRSSEEDQGTLL